MSNKKIISSCNDRHTDEKKKKMKSQIYIVIFVALTIVAVSAIVLVDALNKYNEDKNNAAAISSEIDSQMKFNLDESSDLREEISRLISKIKDEQNIDLIGTYKSVGYANDVTIELKEDGTLTAQQTGETGWWMINEKEGSLLIAIAFQNSTKPDVYQLCGSRLIDTSSIYYGELGNGDRFDAEFVMGDMTLTLTKNGRVNGRYSTVYNEGGEEIPYKEAYGGTYSVDGEYLDIVLNGDATRFVMFDLSDPDFKGGIASLYYEKIN